MDDLFFGISDDSVSPATDTNRRRNSRHGTITDSRLGSVSTSLLDTYAEELRILKDTVGHLSKRCDTLESMLAQKDRTILDSVQELFNMVQALLENQDTLKKELESVMNSQLKVDLSRIRVVMKGKKRRRSYSGNIVLPPAVEDIQAQGEENSSKAEKGPKSKKVNNAYRVPKKPKVRNTATKSGVKGVENLEREVQVSNNTSYGGTSTAGRNPDVGIENVIAIDGGTGASVNDVRINGPNDNRITTSDSFSEAEKSAEDDNDIDYHETPSDMSGSPLTPTEHLNNFTYPFDVKNDDVSPVNDSPIPIISSSPTKDSSSRLSSRSGSKSSLTTSFSPESQVPSNQQLEGQGEIYSPTEEVDKVEAPEDLVSSSVDVEPETLLPESDIIPFANIKADDIIDVQQSDTPQEVALSEATEVTRLIPTVSPQDHDGSLIHSNETPSGNYIDAATSDVPLDKQKEGTAVGQEAEEMPLDQAETNLLEVEKVENYETTVPLEVDRAETNLLEVEKVENSEPTVPFEMDRVGDSNEMVDSVPADKVQELPVIEEAPKMWVSNGENNNLEVGTGLDVKEIKIDHSDSGVSQETTENYGRASSQESTHEALEKPTNSIEHSHIPIPPVKAVEDESLVPEAPSLATDRKVEEGENGMTFVHEIDSESGKTVAEAKEDVTYESTELNQKDDTGPNNIEAIPTEEYTFPDQNLIKTTDETNLGDDVYMFPEDHDVHKAEDITNTSQLSVKKIVVYQAGRERRALDFFVVDGIYYTPERPFRAMRAKSYIKAVYENEKKQDSPSSIRFITDIPRTLMQEGHIAAKIFGRCFMSESYAQSLDFFTVEFMQQYSLALLNLQAAPSAESWRKNKNLFFLLIHWRELSREKRLYRHYTILHAVKELENYRLHSNNTISRLCRSYHEIKQYLTGLCVEGSLWQPWMYAEGAELPILGKRGINPGNICQSLDKLLNLPDSMPDFVRYANISLPNGTEYI